MPDGTCRDYTSIRFLTTQSGLENVREDEREREKEKEKEGDRAES